MKVEIAFDLKKTKQLSFQADFLEVIECPQCDGGCRLAFVAHEFDTRSGKYVANLYKHTSGFWLHDACAVAVYFCKKCLSPTALYNQA